MKFKYLLDKLNDYEMLEVYYGNNIILNGCTFKFYFEESDNYYILDTEIDEISINYYLDDFSDIYCYFIVKLKK